MLDDYSVKLPIHPRFCDTDLLGHLNNAVYLSYFEAGRLKWWATLSGRRSFDDWPFILARAEVDFLVEAGADDELLLGVRCARLGTKSFELEYELVRVADATPVARGRSVQVMFDYAAHASRPISDEERQRIRAFEGARLAQA